MLLLKANTAVDILVGPFLDDTDGKTTEEGLTLTQGDVMLSKNGQAMAQKNDANAATHDDHGFYNCPLDATDTNTEGTLVVSIQESGALPVWHECMVLAEAAYDSLFAAKDTGYMDVNVKAVSEDTTAADNLEAACDGNGYDIGGIDVSELNTAVDAVGSDGTGLTEAGGTGDQLTALATAAALATVDGNVDAILEDTGTTIPGTISTMQGNVTDILADTNELQADDTPAALAAIDGKIDTIDGIVDTILLDTAELQGDWTDGGRLDLIIDDILADTAEIQGDTHNAAEVWDATSASLSLSFETMLDRIYRFLMNKMNITDATGAVALRNDGDSGDAATQTITDNDTTTVRTALSWS